MAAVQLKIMPGSPSVDLDEITKKATDLIVESGSKNCQSKIEPVAFGLNAIIMLFAWEETDPTDDLLDKIRDLGNISSVEVTDFRRALG